MWTLTQTDRRLEASEKNLVFDKVTNKEVLRRVNEVKTGKY